LPSSETFRYDWNKAEHVRAGRDVARHVKALRIGFWVLVVFLIVVAVIGGLAALARGRSVIWSLLPWWLLMIFWLWLLTVGVRRMQARAYAKLHGQVPFDVQFTITDTGVRTESPIASTELKWPVIKRVVETKEFLLFFYNWQCAVCLPRRAVALPMDYKMLTEGLRARLGNSYVAKA
jgi:hypothetical protein